MMKLFLVILILFLMASPGAFAATFMDQSGRSVDVPDNPRRIVALAPSVAEIIYALGEEDRLVAATRYSNHPEAASALPRIGTYARPDVERVASFRPDLCIAIQDGNPRHVIDKIEALGIPVFSVNPRSLSGIMDAIAGMGEILNARENAYAIIAGMKQRINNVRALVARARSRPRVFFQIDASPIVSAGTETFIHELIVTAGGENVAAGPVPYPRYSWEEILAFRPDIAVITSMAGGLSTEDLISAWLRWPRIPAVRNGRLHVVDADLFDRPTPRLLDGLEALVRILHPEVTSQGKSR